MNASTTFELKNTVPALTKTEPPPTIFTEGMIISCAKNGYITHGRSIFEIASMHPSGVLLKNSSMVESYTMDEFIKMNPFPVGKVVTKYTWFWGTPEREWVYGGMCK